MAADENGGGGLAAASLSGGKSGRCRAAAGPLQGRYTRPSFNGAAAVKCFFLSSSFLFSSVFFFKQERKYYRVAI